MRVLAPFPACAERPWHLMYQWASDCLHLLADDRVPKDREGFIAYHQQIFNQFNVRTWGIWDEKPELIGVAWAIIAPERTWVATMHCLIAPEVRGTEVAEEAARVTTRQLATSGVQKIEFQFFPQNARVRGLVRKMGAKLEGIITKSASIEGVLTDVEIWGLYPEAQEA